MARIELTDEESAALREVLQSTISDLHSEIIHTDSFDYRERLKHEREVLSAILKRLGKGG